MVVEDARRVEEEHADPKHGDDGIAGEFVVKDHLYEITKDRTREEIRQEEDKDLVEPGRQVQVRVTFEQLHENPDDHRQKGEPRADDQDRDQFRSVEHPIGGWQRVVDKRIAGDPVPVKRLAGIEHDDKENKEGERIFKYGQQHYG